MKKRNIFQKDIFKERFFVCFGVDKPNEATEKNYENKEAVSRTEAEIDITAKPQEQTLLEDITAEIKNPNSDSKTEEKVISKKIDNIEFSNANLTTKIILLLGENNHKKLIRQIEKKIINQSSALLINDQKAVLLMVESSILDKRLVSNKNFAYYSQKPMVDLIIKSTRLLREQNEDAVDNIYKFTKKILKEDKGFTKTAENAGNLIFALDGYMPKSENLGLIIKAYKDNLPLLISGWKKSNTDKSNLEFIYKNSEITKNIQNAENINFICILLNNLDNDKQKEIIGELSISSKIKIIDKGKIAAPLKFKLFEDVVKSAEDREEVKAEELHTLLQYAVNTERYDTLIIKIKKREDFLNVEGNKITKIFFLNKLTKAENAELVKNYLKNNNAEALAFIKDGSLNNQEIIEIIFEQASPEEKLNASGFEVKQNKKKVKTVYFTMEGTEDQRSFKYYKSFGDTLTNAKSTDEVREITFKYFKKVREGYFISNQLIDAELERIESKNTEHTGPEEPSIGEDKKAEIEKVQSEIINENLKFNKSNHYEIKDGKIYAKKDGTTLSKIWYHLNVNEGKSKIKKIISKDDFYKINSQYGKDEKLTKGNEIQLVSQENLEKIYSAGQEKVEVIEEKENKIMSNLLLDNIKENISIKEINPNEEKIVITKNKDKGEVLIKIEDKEGNEKFTIKLKPTIDGKLILTSTANDKTKRVFTSENTDEEINSILKYEIKQGAIKEELLKQPKVSKEDYTKTTAHASGNEYWFTSSDGKMIFINEKGETVNKENKKVESKVAQYEIKQKDKAEIDSKTEKARINKEKIKKLSATSEILNTNKASLNAQLEELYGKKLKIESVTTINDKIEIKFNHTEANYFPTIILKPTESGIIATYKHFFHGKEMPAVKISEDNISKDNISKELISNVIGSARTRKGIMYEISLFKDSLNNNYQGDKREKGKLISSIEIDKLTKDHAIKDQDIVELDWEKEWENINGHVELEEIFYKTFGIEKNQMHKILEDMVKTFSNKYIDLDDVLKALEDHQKSPFKDSERMNGFSQVFTGDDASRDLLGAMQKLEKEIKGIPDNSSPEKIKERDKKIDRLSVLYTIYRDSYRIMNIITQKDVYIDRKAESFISQHRSQISDASTYEVGEDETLEYQEINGLKIAINSEAKKELQKLYKKIDPKGKEKISDKEIIKLLIDIYGLDELIVYKKCIQKNGDKLILTKIPERFLNPENSKEIIELEIFEKMVHDKMQETREKLKTQSAYRGKLLEIFERYESNNKGQLKILGITMPFLHEAEQINMKGSADRKYRDTTELRRRTSSEALVDHIFSNEYFSVKTKAGEDIKFKIYTFENDMKIINEEGLNKLMNYLINLGKERTIQKSNLAKTTNFDEIKEKDLELDTKTKGFKKIEINKKIEDITAVNLNEFIESQEFKKLYTEWDKLINSEKIEKLFRKSPLKELIDIDKDDLISANEKKLIALVVHNVLQGEDDDISIQKIHKKLTKKGLKTYQAINPEITKQKIQNYEELLNEYEYLEKEIERLEKLKSDKKLSLEDNNTLLKLEKSYEKLKAFITLSSVLTQEIASLGTATIKGKHEINDFFKDLKYSEENSTQLDLLIEGFIYNVERDKVSQESALEIDEEKLSQDPYINKIQKELIKLFKEGKVTKQDIYDLDRNTRLQVGLMFQHSQEKGFQSPALGASYTIPVEINDELTLNLSMLGGWDPNTNTWGAGVNPSIKWEINEKNSLVFGGTAMVDLSNIGNGVATGVGASWNFNNGGNLDHSVSIGVMMTGIVNGPALAYTLSKNPERTATNYRDQKIKKMGLGEIEAAKGIKAKAELIKKNNLMPFITEIDGTPISDEDLVSVYNFIIDTINIESIKEGSEGFGGLPITAVGIGVAISNGVPVIFAGIKISLFGYQMVKPKIGERERMAKNLSNIEVQQILAELDKKKPMDSEAMINFLDKNDRKLYLRGGEQDGRVGILDPANSYSTLPLSNLGFFNESLKKAKMKVATNEGIATPRELEINGTKKKTVELIVQDTYQKDIEIYIDPELKDLNIIITSENRIILPGNNLEGLVITRERFQYPYREEENGSTAADVIIISKEGKNLSRSRIEEFSHSYASKRWLNNKAQEWEEENGLHKSSGTDQIYFLNKKNELISNKKSNKKIEKDYANYTERLYDMPYEEVKELHTLSRRMTDSFSEGSPRKPEDLESLEIRDDFEDIAKKIYLNIKRKIKAGRPDISDNQGLIELANKSDLLNGNKLNSKETSAFIMTVHHEYFNDLFKETTNEKLIEKYDQHNNYLKTLYKKSFYKSLKTYGISPSTDAYAKELTTLFMNKNRAKFIDNINQLPTETQAREDKIQAMMKDIDSNALFYSGTSIRTTNKLLFAASPYINPSAVDESLSGLDKLGLIGGDIEWNINSTDPQEKHIALIMLETMSPRPSLSNVETLMSPMAIELANFTGTAIELGKEKYTKLVEFYEKVNKSDNPSSTMRSLLRDSKTKAAVKEFTELADKIRTKMKDGLPAIIKLKGGIEMAYGAHITSGSYGKCGNTSMLMREAFAIVKENKVVYTSKYVHTDTEVSHYNFDIPIGIMFKLDGKPTETPDPDPEPTPEPEAVPENQGNIEIDFDPKQYGRPPTSTIKPGNLGGQGGTGEATPPPE